MLEVLAGILIAIAVLALVLQPLLAPRAARRDAPDATVGAASDPSSVQALVALEELEADRASGKVSPEAYARLRAKYATLAGARRTEGAEAATRAAGAPGRGRGRRVCPACGPRPEPDAVYCSTCGRALRGE